MMRSGWLQSIAGAAGLVLAACTSAPPRIESHGTTPVVLTESQKSTTLTVELHHTVKVVLPPPREPGLAWQISFHDARFLQQQNEITATSDAPPSVSFLAVREGRTRLRFVLLPATPARAVDPVDHQEVVLTIE